MKIVILVENSCGNEHCIAYDSSGTVLFNQYTWLMIL